MHAQHAHLAEYLASDTGETAILALLFRWAARSRWRAVATASVFTTPATLMAQKLYQKLLPISHPFLETRLDITIRSNLVEWFYLR